MTQEEKKLLLKDISARLTYGVIVDYKEDKYDFHHWKISTLHAPAYSQSGSLINTDSDGWIEYNEYKGCGMSSGSRPLHLEIALPFLRPMSSMTDEERNEYRKVVEKDFQILEDSLDAPVTYVYADGMIVRDKPLFNEIDWLNKNMFDYRGLIEKGLALEAPEGMYK